jgi:hypothetical protein
MNAPEDDRRETPASWGDYSSDETQVVRPPAGGYDKPVATQEPADPFAHPMPAASTPPVGAPIDGETQVFQPISGSEPGGWNPSYSSASTPDHAPAPEYSAAPAPEYPAQPPMTSVYPPSTPGYAPAGYPAAYAPPAQVPAPVSSFSETQPASRVGPGFLTALIGLILSAGGVYLGVKYGVATAADLEAGHVVIKNSLLATAGAVLLFAALGLNGWSPWSTIIPGIGLTGLGGWALFSTSGEVHINDWTKSIFSGQQFTAWSVIGFTLIVGLMMLGASVAATLARSSGKRDGNIIGSRRSN